MMTPEQHKARQVKKDQTDAANRIKWDAQTIPICKGWKIIRFDEYNWGIPTSKERGGGDKMWYFGKLIHAVETAAGKIINHEAKKSLQDILDQQRSIMERIDHLFFAKFPDLSDEPRNLVVRTSKGRY